MTWLAEPMPKPRKMRPVTSMAVAVAPAVRPTPIMKQMEAKIMVALRPNLRVMKEAGTVITMPAR